MKFLLIFEIGFQTTSYIIKNISFMNKVCLKTPLSNNTLPCLFSTNAKNIFHNQFFIIITSITFKFLAQDIHSDTCSFHFELFSTSNEIGGLHYELLLKNKMLMELCGGNYVTLDGFVNGRNGTFQKLHIYIF
jgi:hypothetical protein